MEGNSGFRKELVSRLLHLHFRDCKTKGLGHQWGGEYVGHREGGCPMTPPPSPFPPVSGDALQLMAEFLRIFVLAPGLLEFPPVACKV
ncbi:centromere protein X isoform 12 [Mus musculus]|uniref:centromere protein X isoform 12 n=1 Tax=Mus musculus TaxID=10090 RepID=UPI00299D2D48|nr:centromere protein X isoform 12 [Mus musculus]